MLSINEISFSYSNEKTIKNISFFVEKGQHISILGESGSGKSTLLKLIYGLYDLDEGELYWNDTKILGPKFNLIPGMDFMKYLAQDFDLMPYTTVSENIGKFLSNFYPDKKKQRIDELLELVEMTKFSNVKVKNLSGGQMQRVAIARVLALEPQVLLFDEPFSHIDNSRKNKLRRRVFNYLKEKNITCIIATHDIKDSLSFTDEIIVMKEGNLILKGKTNEVYLEKPTKYIASLFDDVSEITINGENKLFYPHELEVVEKSELEVKVINNYFKGKNYLVEGISNNELVYFVSEKEIIKELQVFLKNKSRK